MIKKYLNKIAQTTSQGDAREESYYGHFSNFLTEFAHNLGKTNTQITILPKKTFAVELAMEAGTSISFLYQTTPFKSFTPWSSQ